MAVERLRINRQGIRELLKSPGVAADLRRRAEAIAAAAGEGHKVDSEIGSDRARAAVITESIPAMIREGRDRNLTSAFGAGRG